MTHSIAKRHGHRTNSNNCPTVEPIRPMFHTFVHNVAPSIPCLFRAARPGTMRSAAVIGDPNERTKPRSRSRTLQSKKFFPARKYTRRLRYTNGDNGRGALYPRRARLSEDRLRLHTSVISTPASVAASTLIEEYLSFSNRNPCPKAKPARTPDE